MLYFPCGLLWRHDPQDSMDSLRRVATHRHLQGPHTQGMEPMPEKMCPGCYSYQVYDAFQSIDDLADTYSDLCRTCQERYVAQLHPKRRHHAKCRRCKLPHVNANPVHPQSYCEACAAIKAKQKNRQDRIRSQRQQIKDKRPNAYAELYDTQNGCCAICGQHISALPNRGNLPLLAIDHDHITGQIRGLLCHACNTGLGCFHDSAPTLHKAIRYLRQHLTLSHAQNRQLPLFDEALTGE